MLRCLLTIVAAIFGESARNRFEGMPAQVDHQSQYTRRP